MDKIASPPSPERFELLPEKPPRRWHWKLASIAMLLAATVGWTIDTYRIVTSELPSVTKFNASCGIVLLFVALASFVLDHLWNRR